MPNAIYHTKDLTSEQQDLMSQYRDICEGARFRPVSGRVERHHVLPRCMGGVGPLEDLVPLTLQEHFNAHVLLLKIFPKNTNLAFACHLMMHDKQGRNVTAEEYEKLKIAHAKAMGILHKGKTKENDEGVARMAKKQRGRTKFNHPGVARMAATLKNRTKENNEGVARMAATLKDRTKETHPGVLAQSEAISGRTKENDEGVARMADLLRNRTMETHSGPRKTSEALSNRTKETHSYIADTADKLCKFKMDQCLEVVRLKDDELYSYSKIVKVFLSNNINEATYGIVQRSYIRGKEHISKNA